MPGSANDINVLDRSPCIANILSGAISQGQYQLQSVTRTQPYYFVDGIYPPWHILIAAHSSPSNPRERCFAEVQESVRKEIECAFGMLRKRFGILNRPCRLWKPNEMEDVMLCCLILHNMRIFHKGKAIVSTSISRPVEMVRSFGDNHEEPPTESEDIRQYAARLSRITNEANNAELRNALVEHYWNFHGSRSALGQH